MWTRSAQVTLVRRFNILKKTNVQAILTTGFPAVQYHATIFKPFRFNLPLVILQHVIGGQRGGRWTCYLHTGRTVKIVDHVPDLVLLDIPTCKGVGGSPFRRMGDPLFKVEWRGLNS